MLTNAFPLALKARYKLLNTVRVQDSKEDAYNAVYECEDAEGRRGIRLSKEITKIAGRALETNLTQLGYAKAHLLVAPP